MKGAIAACKDVPCFRDKRYATLWELSGLRTGLSAISSAFVSVDPGAISPRHWHDATEEIYMIVSGCGMIYLGESTQRVSPGDCVSIPLGLVHAIGNPGPEPLLMWVATSPPYDERDDFEVEAQ